MKPATQTLSRKGRRLSQLTAGLPLLPGIRERALTPARAAVASGTFSRVRPGEPGWPSEAQCNEPGQQVGDAPKEVHSPLATCVNAPASAECQQLFKELKNPCFPGDEVGMTQTLGWIDAWTSTTSVYAVATRNTNDVAAAINFACHNNLRLVVKGGGTVIVTLSPRRRKRPLERRRFHETCIRPKPAEQSHPRRPGCPASPFMSHFNDAIQSNSIVVR